LYRKMAKMAQLRALANFIRLSLDKTLKLMKNTKKLKNRAAYGDILFYLES